MNGCRVFFNSYDAAGTLLANEHVCIPKEHKTLYPLDPNMEFSYSYDLKKSAPSLNEAAQIKMDAQVVYLTSKGGKIFKKKLVYNKK